jgi:hypothetical protein
MKGLLLGRIEKKKINGRREGRKPKYGKCFPCGGNLVL